MNELENTKTRRDEATKADSTTLTRLVRQRALELGFSSVGICAAVEPERLALFRSWLDSGYGGEMRYLSERWEAYRHPRGVLDGVRSLVMLTLDYRTVEPVPTEPGEGRVSRYAWGSADYHDLIHHRLKQLAGAVQAACPEARVRGVVDSAPLLERDFARLAGLGWIGKNTLLLDRRLGSWFFLAALLTDQELDYDEPMTADHCGTCRACLDACPTDAFPEPYVLDATRCISYLTIELRGPVPSELRPGVGDWLFGCDVCQDVCPWNKRAPVTSEPNLAPVPDQNPVDLVELFSWTEDQFRARFRRTPLWRSRRRGILRNAAVVLGNRPTARAVPALARALGDDEPLVRGAAAWALAHYPPADARPLLEARWHQEEDAEVRGELEQALARLETP